MEHAAIVITDSGGVQEETTYLNIPCLTFRNSTERPVTVDLGTNQLIADLTPDTALIRVLDSLNGRAKIGQVPPLWDGHAADRIANLLTSLTVETMPHERSLIQRHPAN
ncbi:MAG: hypothetical protein EOO39_46665, partial [Cytophagaceae bacterium]